MIISTLIQQPLFLLAWVAAIVFVLTIHEFSHALAATLLGDQTAKMNGRLTLNPLSHISWLGFAMLLLVGFGWGRPVPFNPYNLKWPKFGPAVVAAAGPLANLICIILFIIIFRIIFPGLNPLFIMFSAVGESSANLLAIFLSLAVFLNLVLMIFNLIPLPPLDGSKILFSFLADARFARVRDTLEAQGPFILLLLIILDNFLGLNIFSVVFFRLVDLFYNLLA